MQIKKNFFETNIFEYFFPAKLWPITFDEKRFFSKKRFQPNFHFKIVQLSATFALSTNIHFGSTVPIL